MPTDSTASEKAFVDTNVFAYAEDLRDPDKRKAALALIQKLTDEERMVVSTQVINEFCAILVRGRIGNVTNEEDLRSLVEEMEASAEIVILTPEITNMAANSFFAYEMSWYDALIWAAAKAGGCTVIYTEDMPGQPEIERVRYINPFAAE